MIDNLRAVDQVRSDLIVGDSLQSLQGFVHAIPTGKADFLLDQEAQSAPNSAPEHQNLVLPCLTPQPVRLALMASLSSFRANRMSYSNRSAPTLAENCLSCSALRLMR